MSESPVQVLSTTTQVAPSPLVWNKREWYVASFSHEVGRTPIHRQVLGEAIVLFRDDQGVVGALLDRCPHRGAELSKGQVVDGVIECPYHGWRFGGSGVCTKVPGLGDTADPSRFRVPAFPVVERDGYVWVYPSVDHAPEREPFDTTHAGATDNDGYATYRKRFVFETTLEAVVENFADPMHTGFAHRGLFRSAPTHVQPVKVHIERHARRVEWEFFGRPPFKGLVASLIGAHGATMVQRMSFRVPGINRGDVRIGDAFHGITTSLHTPVGPNLVHTFGEFRYRSPLPSVIGNLLARPFVVRIMAQDGEMLRSQTANARRHGGSYRSTEADTFGLYAINLLRRWDRGTPPPEGDTVRHDFTLWL